MLLRTEILFCLDLMFKIKAEREIVMKFFENVKIAAGNTFRLVSKKTGEIVEESKTKYSIFDLNNEIEKIYTEIGKEIYAGYKSDTNVADLIEEKCTKIDQLNDEIEVLRQKLD